MKAFDKAREAVTQVMGTSVDETQAAVVAYLSQTRRNHLGDMRRFTGYPTADLKRYLTNLKWTGDSSGRTYDLTTVAGRVNLTLDTKVAQGELVRDINGNYRLA